MSTSGLEMEELAHQLYQLCEEGVGNTDTQVSYNVIFTTDFILYVPRKKEMAGPCAIK
jgi:ATP adenylyltransferase/5',5'''-P-1,P-4-tetraphosphate phosphorylase II